MKTANLLCFSLFLHVALAWRIPGPGTLRKQPTFRMQLLSERMSKAQGTHCSVWFAEGVLGGVSYGGDWCGFNPWFLDSFVGLAELLESFAQVVPGAQSQLSNQMSNVELRFIGGHSHAEGC